MRFVCDCCNDLTNIEADRMEIQGDKLMVYSRGRLVYVADLGQIMLAKLTPAEIREMPAADVAPVVHGWWKKVRKSRSTWECSVCGTKVGAFFAGCSQYCYCCGAQMGGITE